MFSFVLSLLVLTAMFTLISSAAFLLRRTLLAGREGMMYPFWVVILLISIIPLKLDFPELPLSMTPEEQIVIVDHELVYRGDFSEIERAAQIHGTRVAEPVQIPVHTEPLIVTEARRVLAMVGRYADTIAAVLFILWFSGALFSFAGTMTSYVNTRRLMRLNSAACTDARMLRMLAECRERIGLRREVELRVFDIQSLCSPCVCGILRPTLYLEPGCAKLSDRELACVLTHELTHIRRFDIAIKLFCLFCTAIHWLNPSSQKVQRAVFEDCELACDYSVVKTYGNQISGLYMSTILDFVERFSENSRLVGQGGTGSGLFISEASGAAFLKRRYANMKNFRKDRLATILTGAFTAVCAAANLFALSSCSGITPGALSGAITLTPPMEQMVRAHYGLSDDDFITPEMVDGITSLKIMTEERYQNHILVQFEVNGIDYMSKDNFFGHTRPLPMMAYKNYFDSHIMPAIEEYSEIANETTYYDEKGKLIENRDPDKMLAFYQLKDLDEEELTDRARRELLATFPCLEETGPIYIFDPFASDREINALFGVLDRAGLIEPWELDSYAIDCSSLAYFTNLTEVEFVGLTPVGYDFPNTVKVTYSDAPERVEVNDSYDHYIIEAYEPEFTAPADGSEVVIPEVQSLHFALREYFFMSASDYENLPLTNKHMERITSVKAEIDEKLTAELRAYDSGALSQAVYVRYTINGYELDIIPTYLTDYDYNLLWQSLEGANPTASDLAKRSYSYADAFGLWVLNTEAAKEANGDILVPTEDDKFFLFKAITELSLNKVAIVGKTEDGAYLTQFQAASSRSGGTAARMLDFAAQLDDSQKEIFPNLIEWENNVN